MFQRAVYPSMSEINRKQTQCDDGGVVNAGGRQKLFLDEKYKYNNELIYP